MRATIARLAIARLAIARLAIARGQPRLAGQLEGGRIEQVGHRVVAGGPFERGDLRGDAPQQLFAGLRHIMQRALGQIARQILGADGRVARAKPVYRQTQPRRIARMAPLSRQHQTGQHQTGPRQTGSRQNPSHQPRRHAPPPACGRPLWPNARRLGLVGGAAMGQIGGTVITQRP